jgi:DNA-binding LacI/PurR family transcriptional regulator
MVGIEDVAELAGVSTATVSRALRGKDHVSSKAREKVEAAAKKLGYVASSSASTLATGRTMNIGVVLPWIDRWFFSVILESIESALIEHGYDLTLYNLSGGEEQRKRIFNELLLRKRVDGVLAVDVNPNQHELDNLNRMKKPIVGIGGPIKGARSIGINDAAAAKLAVDHLIGLGHTRIGMIGGVPHVDREFGHPDLRYNGYADAMQAAGLKISENWIGQADFTIEGAYHAAKQLLGVPHDRPSAIFCASDEMGFGTIMAAKDLGLEVPRDVSIIGIDDHTMSPFFDLSTVTQRTREQGKEAVRVLLEILAEPDVEKHNNIDDARDWPVHLVVRGSTAKFSGR